MVLRGNICFSGFYSDDFHVQGAEWGEGPSDVLAQSQVLRPPRCLPISRQHGLNLNPSLLQKNMKKV